MGRTGVGKVQRHEGANQADPLAKKRQEASGTFPTSVLSALLTVPLAAFTAPR